MIFFIFWKAYEIDSNINITNENIELFEDLDYGIMLTRDNLLEAFRDAYPIIMNFIETTKYNPIGYTIKFGCDEKVEIDTDYDNLVATLEDIKTKVKNPQELIQIFDRHTPVENYKKFYYEKLLFSGTIEEVFHIINKLKWKRIRGNESLGEEI